MSTSKRSIKRPFQPSINSYFGHPTLDGAPAPSAQPSPPSSAIPTNIPITIQSSLLNVGMRIRKSVPEGYQTPRKLSCGLPSAYNDPSRGVTGLVPYCGILKIGDHDTQPVPREEDLPPLQLDCDDRGFPSSQESNASSDILQPVVTAAVGSSHKRRREEEGDESDVDSQSLSPQSYPPFSHTRMPNLDHLRPIALPKTRKKPVLVALDLKESEMIDVGDFEEADFLRPGEWG
ncbi:hypothetical protein IMSHALPRED_002548 [Imshaugia aleurites]|uniref:Uncharacterized protein n=1 Tax=Imshaugia aleurites TaxID=172621 RepID=A0A8H3J657_9LECA|nr:hypothetical protein IMSHALPRED_002548 [Imshaugia aleurites]